MEAVIAPPLSPEALAACEEFHRASARVLPESWEAVNARYARRYAAIDEDGSWGGADRNRTESYRAASRETYSARLAAIRASAERRRAGA